MKFKLLGFQTESGEIITLPEMLDIEIDENKLSRDMLIHATYLKVKFDNPLITEEYLMTIHPDLTFLQAGSLIEFCNGYRIRYKECYGDGSIMYPKWLEHKQTPQI